MIATFVVKGVVLRPGSGWRQHKVPGNGSYDKNFQFYRPTIKKHKETRHNNLNLAEKDSFMRTLPALVLGDGRISSTS